MKLVIIVCLILLIAVPAAAQTDIPPTTAGVGEIKPTSTPINLPIDPVNEMLATADGSLQGLPDDLSRPGGSTSIIPPDQGSLVYGYAKWLLSPNIANEVFGPFSGFVEHASIYVGMMLAMGGVYAAVYAIMYAIRWAEWLFNTILKILIFIEASALIVPIALIAVAVMLIVAIIIAIGNFFGGG